MSENKNLIKIDMTGEYLYPYEKSIDLLETAIEKLESDFNTEVELTGYADTSEKSEIIEKEVLIKICKFAGVTFTLAGWVYVDRRITVDDPQPFVYFSGLLYLQEFGDDGKFGGGYNNDHRVFDIKFNLDSKKWEDLNINNM